VELVGDCRRYGGGIVCRMDPVVAGQRISELLELPDGCNALLSMVLMGLPLLNVKNAANS